MQPTKLSTKTILRWALLIIGFYIFYLFSYLLLVRSMLSQLSVFLSGSDKFWTDFSGGDLFWYATYILCWLIVLYIITQLVSFAPNRKAAALIYLALVVVSLIVMLVALPVNTKLLPHLMINGSYIVALLLSLWKRPSLV